MFKGWDVSYITIVAISYAVIEQSISVFLSSWVYFIFIQFFFIHIWKLYALVLHSTAILHIKKKRNHVFSSKKLMAKPI